MFERLLNFLKRNGDVASSVGTGSALSGSFGLLSGGPKAAAAYGLGDFALVYPATLAARKLTQNIKTPITGKLLGREINISPEDIKSGAENIANLGGSVLAPIVVDKLVGNSLYPQQVMPTQMSQQQQLMQEMQQRANVNHLDVQAVAPGTQFQTQGLEFLQKYTEPPNAVSAGLSDEDLELLASYGGVI